MRFTLTGFFMLSLVFFACVSQKKILTPKTELLPTIEKDFIDGATQYKLMMKNLPPDKFPKTYYAAENKFQTANSGDWCSGFYPGTLLYLYEQTRDENLLAEANRKLKVLEKEKDNKSTHDLGFMMYCSFGNAQRIEPSAENENILLTSARSLATRFNPVVGCIKSWNQSKSWDGKTIWKYPVIIDNMMNLELLFYASKVTGDPSFKNIAVTHATTTMKNHLRPDYSSYHVVNYDEATGAVKSKETHQGFSDNSTWSRGQAWGIYGFTMVYRETKDKMFLKTAQGMADYFLAHLPADTIPYWDFNVGEPGYNPQWKYDAAKFPQVPKDASAAAITASALIELSGYANKKDAERYLHAAENFITALSSSKYKAAIGDNGNFILMHGTGGAPFYSEVDVPLTYADYYFVEALKRYKDLKR